MYSNNVINCPFCEADIQLNDLSNSIQCPFCGKMFNRSEGKETRDHTNAEAIHSWRNHK